MHIHSFTGSCRYMAVRKAPSWGCAAQAEPDECVLPQHRLGLAQCYLMPPGIILRAQGSSSWQGYGDQHRDIQATFPIRWILVPRASRAKLNRGLCMQTLHGVKYLPLQKRQRHTKMGVFHFQSEFGRAAMISVYVLKPQGMVACF